MMRRHFLRLLGAATAAPLMPLPAIAAAQPAAYSPAALHAAILHAQSSSHVSAWGLSRLLDVTTAQADALMSDMAQRGILSPVTGLRSTSRWASSRIHKPMFAKTTRAKRQSRLQAQQTEANIDLLMAHLRAISTRYFAALAA